MPDVGVLEHALDRPVGDQPTEVENDETAHRGGDHLEVVLDEQDGRTAFLADAPQDREQLDTLLTVEAGGGLVEHQKARLADEGAGELDEATVAETQRFDGDISLGLEPDELEQLVVARRSRGTRLTDAEQVLPDPPLPATDALGDEHVLARGHAREQLQPLEGASDAQAGAPVGRQTVDLDPVEDDRPRVGVFQAEQRQLKRVVLPAPFGPTSPTASPSSIESDSRLTATIPPKLFEMSRATSRATGHRPPGFEPAPTRCSGWSLPRRGSGRLVVAVEHPAAHVLDRPSGWRT